MSENEKPTPIPDDPEQSKRFEDAARLLGADDGGKVFSRAIGVVVKHHPETNSNEPLTTDPAPTIVAKNGSNKRSK